MKYSSFLGGEPDNVKKFIQNQILILKNWKAGKYGTREHSARVNRYAEKMEIAIGEMEKSITDLFNEAPFALIGHYETSEINKELADLLDFAANASESEDYRNLVSIGMDYTELQWILMGAKYKLSEIRACYPKITNRPKKAFPAQIEIRIEDFLTSVGYMRQKIDKLLENVFHEADIERVSKSTLYEYKSEKHPNKK